MPKKTEVLFSQLKKTCKITGASWVSVISCQGEKIEWGISFGISKSKKAQIIETIEKKTYLTWLAKLRGVQKVQSRKIMGDGAIEKIGCERIYAIGSGMENIMMIVGANQLEKDQISFFQVLAMDLGESLSLISPDSLPRFDRMIVEGALQDPELSLDFVLESLVNLTPTSKAFLALLNDDCLVVSAIHKLPKTVQGIRLSLNEHNLLRKVVNDKTGIVIADRRKTAAFAQAVKATDTDKYWMITPIVLGNTTTGIVAYSHKSKKYESDDLSQAEILARHIASPIEKSLVYYEASTYLQRFSILHKLALLREKDLEFEELILEVKSLLENAFEADRVAVPFLDRKKQKLQDMAFKGKGKFITFYPLDTTLEGSVAKIGESVRINDAPKHSKNSELKKGVLSKLVVPLREGLEIIGVISLESKVNNAFDDKDEKLLEIISSQLGSILENIRLIEEARIRAKNLMHVNEIVNGVSGLSEVSPLAERAAEMIAEKFGYELIMIMLLDESMGELVSEGIAGTGAADFPKGLRYAKHLGVPGKVLEIGSSMILPLTAGSDIYLPIPGWDPGSEICVPLRDGENIFGVINVETQEPDGLGDNDLLAIEALAGALSGVLVSAKRHEEAQTNVAQLAAVQETALDLGTDLELDALLKRVVHRVRPLIDAQGAELGLVDHDKKLVTVLISENPWQDYSGYTFGFMSGVTGRIAAMGEPMAVEDFNAWRGNRETLHRAPFTTVAGVPLILSGEVIGTLVVQDERPNRAFGDKEIKILELLAPQIAIFIRNARLYQELERRVEAQRLAESRLIQTAKLAAVGEMAAGVAHELNNPLTTVTGFTELVIDSLPKNSPEQEDLQLILQEAKRARSVVRQLLDFSRQNEILRGEVDINDLVSTVLGLVHHQAQTSGIELQIKFWDDLPLIRIDRNQIQQVFLNLIYNGIQAMPQGGVMEIQTEILKREEENWVAIMIRDNGEGIPEENIPKLFEPFFTTKPAGKGTGLGLSVSYGIIIDHGGKIEVESKIGEGSAFTVWLPIELSIPLESENMNV